MSTKKIDTLVQDIYELLHEANHTELTAAAPDMKEAYVRALASRDNKRTPLPLWASEFGDGCARKLWYKRHASDEAAPLAPYVRMKFMYGDILEELLLCLAEDAGHTVEAKQERVSVYDPIGSEKLVSGRLDAIIDGHVVDVKSMSTFAFKKYSEQGLTEHNDSFGYRWQVALYHWHMVEEGRVTKNSAPYILGIDKTLGHVALIPVAHLPTKEDCEVRADELSDAVAGAALPERGYEAVPEGASGNMKLDVACSYCDFKNLCWPGLRTFLYSTGPRFLTEVVKEPKVPELHPNEEH